MTENLCRLCKAKGLKKRLILFQLNLDEAILLCENQECVYPLGVADGAKLIVRRQASEVSLKRKRKKKQKQRESEEPENDVLSTKCLDSYLHWQNVNSLCWLHSVLSLVVHNVTLTSSVLTLAQNVDSLIRTVTESFNKAQELVSTDRGQAEKDLEFAREEVWKYLFPRMKCQHGVNDSPVTALPLLLRENCAFAEKTRQVYHWEFSCTACGYQQVDKRKKHVVTFPNVVEDFSLQDPAFLRPCYRCGAPKQRSELVYERMPQCVFMHFEQGLKLETFQDLDFEGENGHYTMMQFIQYKRNPDHFTCWTREPKGQRWMEMDDLKSPVCRWSSSLPVIPQSEVHIVVWEKVCCVPASPLSPTTKEKTTTAILKKPVENIKMESSTPKVSTRSHLNIDCNLDFMSPKNINKALLSPTQSSPTFLPPGSLNSITLLRSLPQKLGASNFEPYIPRKKRLVSCSCPNSPICTKHDPDRSASPLSSPLLSEPFLTWQDIKEQTTCKKINTDDVQSDSGYSSPPSVSSCSSLPVSQSSGIAVVPDGLEDLHVDGSIDNTMEDGLHCEDAKSSSKVCLSYDMNIDFSPGHSRHDIASHGHLHSIELANKLEELLPDCLLENPKNFVNSSKTKDGKDLKLTDFGKLSDEQDQFIRDLLAT